MEFQEEVSRTYKGFDGYAPIMAYIGRERYLVDVDASPNLSTVVFLEPAP